MIPSPAEVLAEKLRRETDWATLAEPEIQRISIDMLANPFAKRWETGSLKPEVADVVIKAFEDLGWRAKKEHNAENYWIVTITFPKEETTR